MFQDFEISPKRFLMAGYPPTVSFCSIGALLKNPVTKCDICNADVLTEKKGEKPTWFEVLQGGLNDTGEVQKKIFFWEASVGPPLRTANFFAIEE